MNKYIKHSLEKFKTDALSKLLYDFSKWILVITILFILSKFIPEKGWSYLLNYQITLSIFRIIIFSIIIISLTVLAVYWLFQKRYKKLENDNFTDELSGLKNYKALKDDLEKRLNELKQNQKITTSLVLIDIDDFKIFNTKYGYNIADQILKKLGELLGNDKRATDETYRFFKRGDEFLIIANNTSVRDAFLAAERKRKLIEDATFVVGDQYYNLKVSCGVTEYKRENDNFETFTDRVTEALMLAKKQDRKNCSKFLM